MKVTLRKQIKKSTGKIDGMVYYFHPGLHRTLGRRIPTMPHQPMNDRYKNISKALKAINPSAEFRANFKAYLALMKEKDDEIMMISWHNLYVKTMWNLAAKYPNLNLETLTRAQIIAENLPCQSLKMAVEAKLMPMYSGYKEFTAKI
jgi:hypothetical protein